MLIAIYTFSATNRQDIGRQTTDGAEDLDCTSAVQFYDSFGAQAAQDETLATVVSNSALNGNFFMTNSLLYLHIITPLNNIYQIVKTTISTAPSSFRYYFYEISG